MRTKYRNVKTIVDGIKFDSKKEAARYPELCLLHKAGEIGDIERQVRWPLFVNDVKICTYISDFCYHDKHGNYIVEDVKGVKTPMYRLKKKLMKAINGRDILET